MGFEASKPIGLDATGPQDGDKRRIKIQIVNELRLNSHTYPFKATKAPF